MLIGIVVTNAIVLIDRVISNEQQGMLMKEALIEAGGTRIRPILMTAVAQSVHYYHYYLGKIVQF